VEHGFSFVRRKLKHGTAAAYWVLRATAAPSK
jgi:hypothetical protein